MSEASDNVERWAMAAAASLRSGVEMLGVELARAEVDACLRQVDFWAGRLPANEQGAARVLARALARSTCKRLEGRVTIDSDEDIDHCVFWAGRALDWADDWTRRRTAADRVEALLHAGGCLARAEMARVMVGRESPAQAALALRIIQAAREAVHQAVDAPRAVEAA